LEIDFNSILALAFAAWAGVVAWIGQGIRGDIKDIGLDLKEESERLNKYVVQTESRLSRLEARMK
jgi:hypothetical protein